MVVLRGEDIVGGPNTLYDMRICRHISSDPVTKKNYLSIRMSPKHTHSIKKVSYFFNVTRCRLMKAE